MEAQGGHVVGSGTASGGGSTGSVSSAGAATPVPRIIWLLWFDGWDKATELHHRCLESWQLYNLGWEVRAITRADLPDLLGDFFPRYEKLRAAMNPLERFGGFWIPPAAESDLLRLALLKRHGGVWVDSTMLCRRPLDTWLPQAAASGFFAFSPEDIKEKLPVMSAFLVASRDHLIVNVWLQRVVEHWSTPSDSRKDLGFFWVHHIFGQIVGHALSISGKSDAEAKRAWDSVPRMTGEYGSKGPHYWVPYTKTLKPAPTPEFQAVLTGDRETPMWKLTNHEVKLADVGQDACFWVMLEETRRQARSHAISHAGGSIGASLAVLSSGTPAAVMRELLAAGRDVGCH